MSWRTRFNARGSFRGAGFFIADDALEFGRRVQIHEFPLRDEPQGEDLGKKAREHSITVYVLGDDYIEERDALINAIEQSGAGTLVHPYFGSLNVTVTQARKSESTAEGGYCRFNLTFTITPPAPLLEAGDTQSLVDVAVDGSLVESINDFADNFDVLNQAADFVDGVVDEVDNVLGAVEDVISGVTDSITALVRAPFNMGVAIMGAFANIERALSKPGDALNLYRGLFTAGNDSPTIPTTTPSRQKQENNTKAVRRIVQQAAVASACRVSAQLDYASLDDAVAMRDELLDAIDAQMAQPMGDALYQSFQDVRAAVVADLRVRGMQLPRIVEYTPLATLPALVIAQRIYGDATREAELVTRNAILHPGFIPAGVPLEVLAHV